MSCDWYESSVLWNNLIGCQILVRDTVTWHGLLSHDLSRECQQFCNRKYKYERGRNSCNDVIRSQSREGDMLQWRYIASSDPSWFIRSHSGYLETKFQIFSKIYFFHNELFQKWRCLPLWQICVTDWNTKISKVYHIKIQPAWTRHFICLMPRPIRHQIKYPILIVQLRRKMISVFSHSW